MFTRNLTMKLKADSVTEFTRIIENEVIPTLRQQQGFSDVIAFISPERSEAVINSLWDSRADAEAYNYTGYAGVLKTLSTVLEGNPRVQTFEGCISTFYKVAAQAV